MAIVVSNLGASGNPDINTGTDAASYANSSWTPPTSGVVVCDVWGRNAAGSNTPTISGNSITWIEITNVTQGGIHKVTRLAADLTGSSTGVTTIDFGGQTQIGCRASFYLVEGLDLSGGVLAAFVQSPTNSTASATSLSITLAAAGHADNRLIAAFFQGTNAVTTPRTNWTELDDLANSSPNGGLETQYRTDAYETTASASWAGGAAALGIASELKAAASGTTYNQSADGTLTPAGALSKSTAKSPAGTNTPAGSVNKSSTKTFTGDAAPAGAAAKQTNKTPSGTVTSAGGEILDTIKSLLGVITPAGAANKASTKTFAGDLTPAGANNKQTSKTFAGTLTLAGALVSIRLFALSVGGTLTPVGDLLKSTLKSLAGSITPTGGLSKQTNKTFAGTLTPSGALDTIKTFLRSMSGDLTPAGSVSKQTGKVPTGSTTPAGSASKQTSKSPSGTLTDAGGTILGTIKSLAGVITPAGALTTLRSFVLFIGGSLTPTGDITKQTGKSPQGTLMDAGGNFISTIKSLAGVITPSGGLTTLRAFFVSVGGTLAGVGTLTKAISKFFSGVFTPVGDVTTEGGEPSVPIPEQIFDPLDINDCYGYEKILELYGGETPEGIPPYVADPFAVPVQISFAPLSEDECMVESTKDLSLYSS